MDNPFAVRSPESLTDQQISDLFVDVFTDFAKIRDTGHTFIHGARGTGKSMMLRYLEPSVQFAGGNVKSITELSFFAVHIPVRTANLSIPQLERLEDASYDALAEHLLLMHISTRVMQDVIKLSENCSNEEVNKFVKEVLSLLESSGWDDINGVDKSDLELLVTIFGNEYKNAVQYLKRLTFSREPLAYTGALCGYLDFFLELVKLVRALPFTPAGPVFLMLDDADNLPVGMTKIINTWVSYRTTADISLKVSTQLRYETYRTLDGTLIETPHDYSEINIGTIYTSKKDHYYQRITEIVKKRLTLIYGSEIDPEKYFPVDQNQENEIEKIKEQLKQDWIDGNGRGGYRASDDVIRHAVPDYMKRLAGKSKSSYTYSYAGFRNLVDISSGVIRAFLEPAALMFNEALSQGKIGSDNPCIPPSIQDKTLKEWSQEFMLGEFDKLNQEDANPSGDNYKSAKQLYNMLLAMGTFFRACILSDLKERKYFSFTISGNITQSLERVLNLGVEWGYLQKSTMGTKEGVGRNKHYILNRRLAPFFKLDPSSYAGYLQVTPEDLQLACDDPKKFQRVRMDKKSKNKVANLQLGLGLDEGEQNG